MAASFSHFSENKPDWLLLTDFASKYRISVSTLRRRIKAGTQPYRFDGGKYYLPDQLDVNFASDVGSEEVISPAELSPPPAPRSAPDEPLITTTSKLLNELKQAYTLILHEKEEQIVYLKEEIADLKTLVRVLESENARLMSDRDRRHSEPPGRSKNPFGTA